MLVQELQSVVAQRRQTDESPASWHVNLLRVVAEVESELPEPLDVSHIAACQALLPNPLSMVLLSEALFYNRLLLVVVESLKQLRRVLDGEQHLSPVTQCFARALLQNQVTNRPSVCWDTSGVCLCPHPRCIH